MTKNSIPLLITLTLIGNSLGCGSSSSGSGTMTTTPLASIAIAFQPAPPASISIVGTATFAAKVSNDSMNLGVNWVLQCNTSNCGALVSAGANSTSTGIHTASGAMVTYSPPATLTINSESVYITAFAAADDTANVAAAITVSGFAGNLKGAYVFQVSGVQPATLLPYRLAGVLVADGNGNITGGEQTYSSSPFSSSDPVTGGSYSINADGTGTIIVTTANANVGAQGMETFSMVLLSSSQSLIAEVDAATSPGETSSGTLDLQTSVAPLAGGYAFAVGGITVSLDPATMLPDPLALGGVLKVDSPGSISGNGSVVDEDVGSASNGGAVSEISTLCGTVSAPDPLGAATITIQLTCGSAPAIEFTGYIVDGTHIKLVESDNVSGSGFGATSGVAIGQGTATGSFTTNAALNQTFVYGLLGQISTIPYWSLFSLVGVFTADGMGNLIDGLADENSLLTGTPISDTLLGNYAVDVSGTGRVTTTNMTFGSSGPGPALIFYLTGNGNAPLVLDADISTLAAGVAYPQAAGPLALNGPYGFNLTRFDPVAFQEADATGQFTANGTANTLSGVETLASAGATIPEPLSGTFTSGSSGRFTATLNEGAQGVSTPISAAIYMIDSNHGLLAELLNNNQSSQLFSLGQFAARTPICSTCPDAARGIRRPVGTPIGPAANLSRQVRKKRLVSR